MRVRFAPSPTGALHIGGARTALYNWLLARQSGGAFVLRIEDTDRERSTPENVEQIYDALRWLELDWDEGPFSQAERRTRHEEEIQRLVAEDHAYLHEGAVRLRVPDEGATTVQDVIRGEVVFEHAAIDDFVIARSDGSPLYNLAVAVDDHDMGITHVVRGADHISNTPRQLMILEALGAEPPAYAHVPLLHGPDGKKLSKRHGAASVQDRREGVGEGDARRRRREPGPRQGGSRERGAVRPGGGRAGASRGGRRGRRQAQGRLPADPRGHQRVDRLARDLRVRGPSGARRD